MYQSQFPSWNKYKPTKNCPLNLCTCSELVLYGWSYVAQVCHTGSMTAVVLCVAAAQIRKRFYVLY